MRVVLPPSHTIALVELSLPQEARAAFRSLAYRRFHNEPLYLEVCARSSVCGGSLLQWAPAKVFKPIPAPAAAPAVANEPAASVPGLRGPTHSDAAEAMDVGDEGLGEESQATVFVKNLSFTTKEEDLAAIFSQQAAIRFTCVCTAF